MKTGKRTSRIPRSTAGSMSRIWGEWWQRIIRASSTSESLTYWPNTGNNIWSCFIVVHGRKWSTRSRVPSYPQMYRVCPLGSTLIDSRVLLRVISFELIFYFYWFIVSISLFSLSIYPNSLGIDCLFLFLPWNHIIKIHSRYPLQYLTIIVEYLTIVVLC